MVEEMGVTGMPSFFLRFCHEKSVCAHGEERSSKERPSFI